MESSICSPDLQGQYVVRVDLQVEAARLGICCADGWKETLRAFEPVLLHLLFKFVVKLLIKNPGQVSLKGSVPVVNHMDLIPKGWVIPQTLHNLNLHHELAAGNWLRRVTVDLWLI